MIKENKYIKTKKTRLFLVLFITFLSVNSNAQFQLNGVASELGKDSFQLTTANSFVGGSVWSKAQHILDEDLLVKGKMYFGTSDDGADGMAFILQNECLASGATGGGLGYDGFPGNSIAVEFDIYANQGLFADGDKSDPNYDHIAIHRDGNTDHINGNNLVGPEQMHLTKTNVEDGLWYDFEIRYSVSTNKFDVYFDGSLRVSHIIDLKTEIFSGGGEGAFWGFSASTGSKVANHRLYIEPIKDLSKDTICKGETSTIIFPELTTSVTNSALNKSVDTWTLPASGAPPIANFSGPNENVTNGNTAQTWPSAPVPAGDSLSVEIDLGGLFDINLVRIYWGGSPGDYGKDILIQTSVNGNSWATQATGLNNSLAIQPFTFTAAGVRYVRIIGLASNNAAGTYIIGNVEIFSDPKKYLWSPDDGTIDDITSRMPIFTPEVTTTYTLIIPDQCLGEVEFEYTVVVINCGPEPIPEDSVIINEIIIPTGFTPDNDGFNDEWVLSFMVDFPDAQVQVFNRWGSEIYNSKGGDNYESFKGLNLPVGSYPYIITLNDEENKQFIGNISLIK